MNARMGDFRQGQAFLSCYGQAEDKENSRRVGFDNHLTKPVDFGVLQLALTELSRRAS